MKSDGFGLRKMGLEPTRYCYHKILSLARLPVPTLPHLFTLLSPLFSPTTNIIIAPVPGFVNSYFEIYEKNSGFFLRPSSDPLSATAVRRETLPPHSLINSLFGLCDFGFHSYRSLYHEVPYRLTDHQRYQKSADHVRRVMNPKIHP